VSQTNLLARCISVAGLHTSGVLLYRICYWHPYGKIDRGDKTWIAKPKAEWMAETCLTEMQYRHATKALKTARLIELEQHLFRGKNITFMRLTDRGLLVREGGTDNDPGVGMGNVPQEQGDTHKEIPDTCFACVNPLVPKQEEEAFTGKDDSVVKVHDILLGKGKKPTVPKKPDTPGTLRFIWHKVVAEVFDKTYTPPLTMKQMGLLGQFVKACPPGQAAVVLEKVLREWGGFVGQAKSVLGYKNVPSEPMLEFLVKHVGVAVNFATTATEPKSSGTIAPKAKPQVPKPVKLIAQDEEKASLEEVLSPYEDGDGEG
jgi:hypothetical protein